MVGGFFNSPPILGGVGGGRFFPFGKNLPFLPPNPCQRSLDLLLEAGDQLVVSGDQRLLGFDLGDYGLLGGEGWEGDFRLVEAPNRKLRLCGTRNDCFPLRSEVFRLEEMKKIAA